MSVAHPVRGNVASIALCLCALAGLLSIGCNQARVPGEWVNLDGCVLVPEKFHDGDSFYVRHKGEEFAIRLYLVDAPETENDFPERVREQSEHFGVSPERVLKAGQEAKKAVEEILGKRKLWVWKNRFTVVTRRQAAPGMSHRFYAQVKLDGKDLGEELVRRGLARAKGQVAILPDGRPAKEQMEKIRKLEDNARADRVGLWNPTGTAKVARPSIWSRIGQWFK